MKSLLLLMIISSVAFAGTPEQDFEITKKEAQKEKERQKKQAPIQQLEERARLAAHRLGLREEEFTLQVSNGKAYLRTSDQACKLVSGKKTLRGMDCGLTYPSPWAVVANSCEVDDPTKDTLECYPIRK